MNDLSVPHLLPTPQQVDGGNTNDEVVTVFLNESSLDLADLRSHRSAERSAPCVIDVQPDDRSQLRNRPTGGLQCVAAHRQDGKTGDAKPTKSQH